MRKALVVVLLLVATACGSGEADPVASGPGGPSPAVPAYGESPPADAQRSEQRDAPGPAAGAPAASEPAIGAAAGPVPGGRSASAAAVAPKPSERSSGAALPDSRGAGVQPRPESSPAAAPGGPARASDAPVDNAPGATGPASDRSPLVIGSLGTLSGPAGSIIRQTAEGVQVWVAWINARGGVNGRPVKHFMADDGADPARYRAELQRLVESENVVAMVGNPDALTGAVGVGYLVAKRVPYIGGDGGGDWFYQSPMHFPQGTVGYTFAEAELRDAALYAKSLNKSKFGTVTCTEADFCRVADRIWNEQAKAVGLDPVYRGRTSLVQPDFTAECLAAQRAGVELLEVALDANSIRRLAVSCSRQGYQPLLGWPAGIAKDDQKGEATLQGARISLFTFPWTQSDSPATGEFQEAMKRYGKSLRPFTAGHAGGWVAAKMFEKAVTAFPGKVTRESVLVGLWAFKDETLGGLTSPLTFTRDQTAPRTRCWVSVVIKDGEFEIQRDGKFTCG